ncbi:hypothetical protein L9F63_004660 [Diploptera punctata]|uniref:Uncharacterized protein n=1 Tax=Diploptera punctata TaxID=6984 RepID=A0AAD8E7M3_DIPPU|nr:hypothetical protein L9F63_004660 [Diploptera punctata]
MGLIERYDVARHRPLTKNSKQNLSSFKYFAIKGTSRVEVCRNAYISLHAISSKVVQRLTKLVATNQSPGVIKYEYYLKHFNDNYGYRFGRPQVDVCSTCEDLNTKIKSSTLNDVAKRAAVAELLVHKRRAKKFYSKMENVKNICKERNDVMAIAFDFMQNMPLPFIPVQEMFYLQGEALRGPNEVCSCLLDFINQISEEVKILYVFSDACAGQNRNHTLTRQLVFTQKMKGCVEASEYIDGLHHGTFRLKKQDYVELPTTAAYTGKLGINIKKIQDISKVTHYIPDEYKSFYEDILKYPTSNTADSDKDE